MITQKKPSGKNGGTKNTPVLLCKRDRYLFFWFCTAKFLVAETSSVSVLRKAGLPADRSNAENSPSRFPSGIHEFLLTKYGDEFVQDSHLFPFSPDRTKNLSDTLRISCEIDFKQDKNSTHTCPLSSILPSDILKKPGIRANKKENYHD